MKDGTGEKGRHPIHAVLVHFPVALFPTAFAADVVGAVRGEDFWWTVSFWNILTGLIVGTAAIGFGFFDFTKVKNQDSLRLATKHMTFVVAASFCFLISLVLRRSSEAPAGWVLAATLLLEAVGFTLLSVGGWLGGQLAHGLSRESR